MADLMPFDELNAFRKFVEDYKRQPGQRTPAERIRFRDDLWEYIEYLLIESYVYGNVQARADLGLLDDENEYIDSDKMQDAIRKKIADKTVFQRLEQYAQDDSSTVEDIQRVAETDATRVYNTSILDTAENTGLPGIMKRWETAEDDRVREQHEYLQSMVVPYKQDFYTFDGDHARAPGLFSLPENNINCRCTISLFRE